MKTPALLVLAALLACILPAAAKPAHPTQSPTPSQAVTQAALWQKWKDDCAALQKVIDQLKADLAAAKQATTSAKAETSAIKTSAARMEAWGVTQQARADDFEFKYNQTLKALAVAEGKLEKARHQLIYLRVIICIVLGLVAGLFGVRLVPLVAPLLGPYAALAALTPVALGLVVAAGVYFGLMALP